MMSPTDYLISLTCFSVNSSFEISEKLPVGLPSSRTTNRTGKKKPRPHLRQLFSVKKKTLLLRSAVDRIMIEDKIITK